MKYYRLLDDKGYPFLEKNKIYPGDFVCHDGWAKVEFLSEMYPEDWKIVKGDFTPINEKIKEELKELQKELNEISNSIKSNSSSKEIKYLINHSQDEAVALYVEKEEFKVLKSILKEYRKAKEKHPSWPSDLIHQSSIVAEESGELVRAALQEVYENGSREETKKEAVQTCAMALRFLIELGG